MGHKYAEITFTPAVRAVQLAQGSHDAYESVFGGETFNHTLGEREALFIQARDSFYMASISESGWPYIQHRGGAEGFMKIIDEKTIGFADFSGNRQYISTGNLMDNDRVALFFMDYPNRTRLKVLGRAEIIDINQSDIIAKLEDDHYRAQIERGFIIHIEAFDWNCPQHITPRYTDDYINKLMTPLIEENKLRKSEAQSSTTIYSRETGDGPLKLVITGVRQLASRVRAYELRDPDRKNLPEIQAGSHIQIPVLLENGKIVYRHYSICSNPMRSDMYEIAVLLKHEGNSASHVIHTHFEIGMVLNCKYPENYFQLHKDQRPAILIAGGIGITPLKPMAQQLKSRGTHLHLYYAGRNRKDLAFRDRLERELGNAISIYSSVDGTRMNIEQALVSASKDAVIYVCGPARLIDSVIETAAALHIEPQRIRFERFATTMADNAKSINVELQRSGKTLEVSASQSILDALLEAGIDVPFNCRTGTCKTCAVKILAGVPEHNDTALSPAERDQHKLMCPCVSRAKTTNLVLDL